jgi:transglutaminase-like putative cysteine protease
MLIDIEHRLLFRYDAYISESFMELRVEPQSDAHQSVLSFYLAVGPPTQVARYQDWNQNQVHHFGISDYHDRIEVFTRCSVETHPAHPDLASLREPVPRENLGPLLDFQGFGGPVLHSPRLERLASEISLPREAPLGEQIAQLGGLIRDRFEYRTDVTDYQSTSDHVLEEGAGVCQDFAHLMLALLRTRDIAARYVSGYLHVDRDDETPSQSHAWVEVYAGGAGWVGFDPTHDQIPGANYVAVARGRHYDDVPPNRGIFRGNAREQLEAEVVTRLTAPKDAASVHREIGRIDLPVFRELPRQAAADTRTQPGSDQQQQQQQQQQAARRRPRRGR